MYAIRKDINPILPLNESRVHFNSTLGDQQATSSQSVHLPDRFSSQSVSGSFGQRRRFIHFCTEFVGGQYRCLVTWELPGFSCQVALETLSEVAFPWMGIDQNFLWPLRILSGVVVPNRGGLALHTTAGWWTCNKYFVWRNSCVALLVHLTLEEERSQTRGLFYLSVDDGSYWTMNDHRA